ADKPVRRPKLRLDGFDGPSHQTTGGGRGIPAELAGDHCAKRRETTPPKLSCRSLAIGSSAIICGDLPRLPSPARLWAGWSRGSESCQLLENFFGSNVENPSSFTALAGLTAFRYRGVRWPSSNSLPSLAPTIPKRALSFPPLLCWLG